MGPQPANSSLSTRSTTVTSRSYGQAERIDAVLKAARDAIGGDAKVRSLKSLRLTGTMFSTQAVSGGYTYDTEEPLDIRFALPHRFVEIIVRTMGSRSYESQKGFVGERTISTWNGKPTDSPAEAAYVRKTAAELLLIFLVRTEPWGDLTIEAIGPNAIKVRGLGGYASRLDFDPSTHLLSKLTYWERRQVRPRNTILRRDQKSGGGSAALGGGAGGSAIGDLPEVEIAITFHDRRKVDGFLLPHRITTTAVAQKMLLWEMRFEKIIINPPLTDADFGGRQN